MGIQRPNNNNDLFPIPNSYDAILPYILGRGMIISSLELTYTRETKMHELNKQYFHLPR